MIDVNAFLLMLLYILGSILLVISIVLIVKLIRTVDRVNGTLDELNSRISKFDRAFRIVDILTDNMALISDKIVDGVSAVIRKLFYRNDKRKEEEIDE